MPDAVKLYDHEGNPIDENNPLPTTATINAENLTVDLEGVATEAKQDTQITALDAIQTAAETLASAVDTEIQVDVVSSALPANAATETKQDAEAALIGAANETAPASDTASSGLNGRLQRIAQRLTTALTGIILAAGENHIGEVGGKTVMITPTITVSTTPAYTAGDSIGGKITLSNAVRVSGGTAVLQSLTLLSRSNQKFTGDFLIYNADPSAATLTDNTALANLTDDIKVIARIPLAASDWVTISTKAYATLRNLGAVVKPTTGTSLYVSFCVTSTPTFAATTDVQAIFGLLQD